jgi:hypothetical protein
MDVETIAGLIGLGVGLLILIGLSVFESREYRHEHNGEGMVHHWLSAHHVFERIRHRH